MNDRHVQIITYIISNIVHSHEPRCVFARGFGCKIVHSSNYKITNCDNELEVRTKGLDKKMVSIKDAVVHHVQRV